MSDDLSAAAEAYDREVRVLRPYHDDTAEAFIAGAHWAFEQAKRLADDMFERGAGRGTIAWGQAWGSGVLDVSDAIRARAAGEGESK